MSKRPANTLLSPTSLIKSSISGNVNESLTNRTRCNSLNSTLSPYELVKQTLLCEITTMLPGLVTEAVNNELKPIILKRDELKNEIGRLQKTEAELTNKVEGYKKQVENGLNLQKEQK